MVKPPQNLMLLDCGKKKPISSKYIFVVAGIEQPIVFGAEMKDLGLEWVGIWHARIPVG